MTTRPLVKSAGLQVRPILLLSACITLITWACAPDEATQPSAETSPTLSAASAVTYTARDLGTLGGTRAGATDINNAGIVVGSSTTREGTVHAFRWKRGVMTDLGTLGGSNSSAEGINNEGVVVGWSQTTRGTERAVRWKDGVKRNLGTLGGRNSRANEINAFGWVVGWSQTASGETHAFLWKNGVMTDLGTLGGPVSVATAISRNGVVVGYSTKTAAGLAKEYPFRWKDGRMRELPSTGGRYTIPNDINSIIVGTGEPEDVDDSGGGDFSDAVIWTNGVLTDLGRMGGAYARANGVNADGLVAGHIDHNPPDCVWEDAFVWNQGNVTLLPRLGGQNSVAGASAINLDGLVVGFSETDIGSGDCTLGEVHAVLWTPN